MNCETALALIYDLVDGEILPKDEALLNSHLANCLYCQATLKSVQAAEKLYQSEILVSPSQESASLITSQVLQNKNVVSLPVKNTYWSTKRILYYVGAMAASFAAFIYLTGAVIVANFVSNIDFSANNGFHIDMSFNQLTQLESDLLTIFTTINAFVSQSTLLKDLAIILFLASLQFTISYLFTQSKPKQDNKL